MADTDSFINEVSEEVRRDRLFALFRKWAWLAALLVILIVGGAAYFEYRRAQAEASAQAFGDAIIGALDAASPGERIAALEGIAAPGPEGEVLLALLAAGEVADDVDRASAAARLRQVAETPDLSVRYRHLAVLKAHMLDPAPEDEARLVLGALAEPGAPYAALAEEQLALMDIVSGDTEAGIERLRRLEIAAGATPGLQQRVAQLIVALESGAVLIDTAPVEDTGDSNASPLGGDGLLPPAGAAGIEDGGTAEPEAEAPAAEDGATTEPEAEAPADQ
jgi:hypothetical protein